MRDDILQATLRVLCRDGALRLTTPRVAEAAGISVGSLYQYYPNKQALLFALHTRVVEAAWAEVESILDHPRWSAREKVRRVARLYFRAESEDVATMGSALQDAEIHFANEPEHRAMDARVLARFRRFVRQALPEGTPRSHVAFGTDLLVTTLESVGRSVAGRRLPRRAVDHWASVCAEMVSAAVGLA
jgi:AcrR family transcriptional regulator